MLKFNARNPAEFRSIFEAEKLSELRKLCRKIVIYGDDFANMIVQSSANAADYGYMPIFKHHDPEHLTLTDEDLNAIGRNGVGPMSSAAQKAARKIGQSIAERRHFSGHLFWKIYELGSKPLNWHLFHLDDKSISRRDNHWSHGPHLHLMNHLTHPNLPLDDLLDKIDGQERPWLGGGLHIRFER